MQIHIDSSDGVPIYLQIVNQVKYLAASGRLAPGEEMPAIRVLASQLVVNPNTVARAYLELERAGIVHKRQGAGTYVSENSSQLTRRGKLKLLKPRAEALVVEADHLGVDLADVLEVVRECHEAIHAERPA